MLYAIESQAARTGVYTSPPDPADLILAIIFQADHQVYQPLDFRHSPFTYCQVVLDRPRLFSRESVEPLGMHYIASGDDNPSKLKRQRDEYSFISSTLRRKRYIVRLAAIVGGRPQFIKLMPVSDALRQQHEEIIIHTGQHYDYRMSALFFDELNIPVPDYHLGIASGSCGAHIARMLSYLQGRKGGEVQICL